MIAALQHGTSTFRDHFRSLIVRDGTVWLWPGVPLTVKLEGVTQPLPNDCVRFWILPLHGFEAQHAPIEKALANAALYLTIGREDVAQDALDGCGLDRFSPEGALLAEKVADRLGIQMPKFFVGTRSLPWALSEPHLQLELFEPFANVARKLEKAWDPDKHPRWDKHSPDGRGGKFRPTQAGASANQSPANGPGIGHNGGPPLDDLPKIPDEEPISPKITNKIVKGLAKWAAKRGFTRAIPFVGWLLTAIDVAFWIKDYGPYIEAYLDGPKSLEELNAAADAPERGYDIHHIVEQTPARNEGYTDDQIEAAANRVRVSTLKHWEITGWYNTKNDNYGGVTPRQYLRGKNWDIKRKVGLDALIHAGVLKP